MPALPAPAEASPLLAETIPPGAPPMPTGTLAGGPTQLAPPVETIEAQNDPVTSQEHATAGPQMPDSVAGLEAGAVQRARLDPRRLSPAEVLPLQRVMGNRAVSRLLAGVSPQQPSAAVQREAMPAAEDLSTQPTLQREEAMEGGEAAPDLASAIDRCGGIAQELPSEVQQNGDTVARWPQPPEQLSNPMLHKPKQET